MLDAFRAVNSSWTRRTIRLEDNSLEFNFGCYDTMPTMLNTDYEGWGVRYIYAWYGVCPRKWHLHDAYGPPVIVDGPEPGTKEVLYPQASFCVDPQASTEAPIKAKETDCIDLILGVFQAAVGLATRKLGDHRTDLLGLSIVHKASSRIINYVANSDYITADLDPKISAQDGYMLCAREPQEDIDLQFAGYFDQFSKSKLRLGR